MTGPARLSLYLTLLLPLPAFAWGTEGHKASAAITADRLCPAAALAVQELLDGMTVEEASTWPDRVRRESRWEHARDWHYINIGDEAPFSALIEGAPGHGRLLSAIRENLALLADERAGGVRRREALSWVVHLVGDLHQPLHVGRSEDRGGNTISVRFQGQEMSLHELWDGALLRSAGLRPDDYHRSLEPLAELGAAAWAQGTLEHWAFESRRLRPWVYDFDARRRVPLISKRYAETGRQLTSLRLAQAGVRTAWLLNRLWCE
jgi:hypothetical protein